MFSPVAGWAAGFSFLETFLVCISGGVFSASIFYFGSSYFMNLAVKRRARRAVRLAKKGKKIKEPKKFTRTNRRIIKVKRSVGIYGVTWMFPLFLSVPLGVIITAKFYKHQKQTFPLIVLFLVIDCISITGLTFLLK
jgi:hypothetical protein